KDRARRYAQMSELVADIDRLVAGDQNVGTPVTLPESQHAPAGGASARPRGIGFLAGGVTLFLVVGGITAIVAAKRKAALSEIPAVPVLVAPASASAPTVSLVLVEIRANTSCIVYK